MFFRGKGGRKIYFYYSKWNQFIVSFPVRLSSAYSVLNLDPKELNFGLGDRWTTGWTPWIAYCGHSKRVLEFSTWLNKSLINILRIMCVSGYDPSLLRIVRLVRIKTGNLMDVTPQPLYISIFYRRHIILYNY